MSDRPNSTDKENFVEEPMSQSERDYKLGLPNLDYIYKVPPERKGIGSEMSSDEENTEGETFPLKKEQAPGWRRPVMDD